MKIIIVAPKIARRLIRGIAMGGILHQFTMVYGRNSKILIIFAKNCILRIVFLGGGISRNTIQCMKKAFILCSAFSTRLADATPRLVLYNLFSRVILTSAEVFTTDPFKFFLFIFR